MRILVLGGAGYVGAHAVRALARDGYDPEVYDNLSTGHAEFTKGFRFTKGDLRDREKLLCVLKDCEAVLHFAAHAYVGESVADPRKYFANNVEGSLCVLNAVLDSGVRNLIFSSTCATYGIPKEIPIADSTVQNPVNPYGASKLFFERALKAYDTAYEIRSVSLRYFNAAGADDSATIGEVHTREARLIPAALEAIEGIRPALQIFGEDYPTPDGTCIRDYVHVNDLADAHVAALEYLLRGGETTAFNLGTGQGNSVKEVLGTVERVTGRKVPVQIASRRPGDPPVLVADPRRAEQVLKWKAKRNLENMVATAWNWAQRKDETLGLSSAQRLHVD